MPALTTKILAQFLDGGQFQVMKVLEEKTYQGEMESVAVENDSLKVEFKWLALRIDDDANRWQLTHEGSYECELATFEPRWQADGSLTLISAKAEQVLVFFPKDHRMIVALETISVI